VTQDPTDEPASELLKRIAAKKAAFSSRGRKGRELVDSSENTDEPFAVPRTWKWSRLGEIAFEMRYGTARKCDYNIKGTPVLRIPNVSGGKINLTDIKFGVLTTKEIEVLSLRLGDLLLVRSNGSLDLVGRCAEVEGNAEGMSFAGYLVRVRLSSIVTVSSYVRVAMNTDHVRDQIEKPIRSAVGLKNVNSTELAALTIPLPPLAEQHRIVAKVDELMALCDRLEVNFWKIETDSRRLVEAVLHEALVPDAAREEAA
jgi:type I restriction enzyme S subunit